MRLECPVCGARDSGEFSFLGAASLIRRPGPEDGQAAFFDYLHMRDNPAGRSAELWHHGMGCRSWLVVERDTLSHEVFSVVLASEAAR